MKNASVCNKRASASRLCCTKVVSYQDWKKPLFFGCRNVVYSLNAKKTPKNQCVFLLHKVFLILCYSEGQLCSCDGMLCDDDDDFTPPTAQK